MIGRLPDLPGAAGGLPRGGPPAGRRGLQRGAGRRGCRAPLSLQRLRQQLPCASSCSHPSSCLALALACHTPATRLRLPIDPDCLLLLLLLLLLARVLARLSMATGCLFTGWAGDYQDASVARAGGSTVLALDALCFGGAPAPFPGTPAHRPCASVLPAPVGLKACGDERGAHCSAHVHVRSYWAGSRSHSRVPVSAWQAPARGQSCSSRRRSSRARCASSGWARSSVRSSTVTAAVRPALPQQKLHARQQAIYCFSLFLGRLRSHVPAPVFRICEIRILNQISPMIGSSV